MNTGGVSGGRPAGPAEDVDGVYFDLRLYVAGQSPKSILAIENLRRVCDEHLPGRYRIEASTCWKPRTWPAPPGSSPYRR